MNKFYVEMPTNTMWNEAFQELSKKIVEAVLTAEENIINQVLTIHLKRLPTTYDYKLCQRIYREGYPDKYLLMYDHLPLGYVDRSGWDNKEFQIKFTPYE